MVDKILLDLDGVLVDFIKGAKQLHRKDYPYHPHNPSTQHEMTPWELEPVFEMDGPELWEPMGFDFWANLDPLPHMNEFLELLESKFGEENICILTSPIRTDGCIDGKMSWIKKNIPRYKRRFLVGPAKEFCAGPSRALVDDSHTNVDKFRQAGGHALLVPAPWNPRFKECPVAALKSWLRTFT